MVLMLFKNFIVETDSSSEKGGVLAFGRMNPPTKGHQEVVNKVKEVAGSQKDHLVVLSHSHDAAKNPLPVDVKVKHARHAFPNTNIVAASKESPSILHHAAKMYKSGVRHLHFVGGSDRKPMFDLLKKYNDKKSEHGHYNFKSITFHNAGERDENAKGTAGISGTKMRSFAAAGNKKEFHAGLPTGMSSEHKEALYKDLRHHMGIKEVYDPHLKISEYQWGEKKGTDRMKQITPGQKIPYLLMTKEQRAAAFKEDVASDQLEFDGVQTKNFDMCPAAYKEFKSMIEAVRLGKHLGELTGHTDVSGSSAQVRSVQAGIAMKPDTIKNMQFKQYTGI